MRFHLHPSKLERPRLEILEDRTLMSSCHVTRLSDVGAGMGFRGDLRYCINKVNVEPGPDTIQIVRTGTINLTAALPNLASEIDIQGPGASLLTVRGSAQTSGPKYRVFTIPSGGDIAISGLTISNGSAFSLGHRGGGIHNSGTLDLIAVVVSANYASSSADGEGGGVYNSGNLTIDDSLIGQNTAGGGGGLHNAVTGIAVITNTTISGNLAKYFSPGNSYGGGIYNAGMLTLDDCDVSQNATFSMDRSYGGAVYNIGTLTVRNTTISNSYLVGERYGYGGGVYNAAMLTMSDSTISDNAIFHYLHESNGGGIYSTGTLTVSRSTISGNSVKGDGFTSNGGGIYAAGTATISDSIIVDNVARGYYDNGYGGGIYATGTFTLTNSTVANNSADSIKVGGRGGGIYGRGTVTNCTIVGNFASEFGGGIYVSGALGLRNTIVAASYAPQGPDLWGSLSSSHHNLFGDTSGGSGYDPTTDLLNVDPLLGPLADNGGPTLTFSLLPGSPAIDAGDNTDAPEFDQRGPGFPRIVNGTIDIGAFEVQATGAPGTITGLRADVALWNIGIDHSESLEDRNLTEINVGGDEVVARAGTAQTESHGELDGIQSPGSVRRAVPNKEPLGFLILSVSDLGNLPSSGDDIG